MNIMKRTEHSIRMREDRSESTLTFDKDINKNHRESNDNGNTIDDAEGATAGDAFNQNDEAGSKIIETLTGLMADEELQITEINDDDDEIEEIIRAPTKTRNPIHKITIKELDENDQIIDESGHSADGEDMDVMGILEEALDTAYKTKLYNDITRDTKKKVHDPDKYERQLETEYIDIVNENRKAVREVLAEKKKKKTDEEESAEKREEGASGLQSKKSKKKSPKKQNMIALPTKIPTWDSKTIHPKPISDEEVRALYRESLLMDELEAMVEEKKLEELKKRARENPIVKKGPARATPVTVQPSK